MSVNKKVYAAEDWIIASDSTYTTLSGITISYSSNVDHETEGYDGSDVTIEIDFDSTPTDNVKLLVFPSYDGTNYDTSDSFAVEIDNAIDPGIKTINVPGFSNFRVGAQQTGATDSHDVRVVSRSYRYENV
jgi:hypothetical protein